MDHLRTYARLIDQAQARLLLSSHGYHLHHIVPKSLGGTDDTSNLVFLTHREHVTAHTLLAHIWPNQWFAVQIIALRTRQRLPRWKRRRITWQTALVHRLARARGV
ncbi:HNH endonuclease signature motif containing protein [Leptothrix discophora]|uniref:HNH endonuclease signature motif containing protein n=1 Tax=Leptothrix discophora TaxID=89 RepID=A0ABT9G0F8_LEPDI|nr:HNH endonuclease signature motif containing protein [Leptothrix discophora]MDP4299952.1 HNH endonuclease signature motif containing protein [Leptothrix discophora]